MAVREFRELAKGEWEGIDLSGLAVYVLRRNEDRQWELDVFTAAETSGDPWIWGDTYSTLGQALSCIPALPEACSSVFDREAAGG